MMSDVYDFIIIAILAFILGFKIAAWNGEREIKRLRERLREATR